MTTWRDVVVTMMGPLIGGYLGVLTLGGAYTVARRLGPQLETAVSPVVRFGGWTEKGRVVPGVDHVYRDGERVCFDLHIAKLHAAVPVKYVFFAEAQFSIFIPLAAYLTDPNRARLRNADLTTHAVGERWTRHYCADLDRRIAGLDIRISGEAIHRRHAFYDTPTPIPSFTVPAP